MEIVIKRPVCDRPNNVLLQFERPQPGQSAKTVLSQRTDLVSSQAQAFQSHVTEAVVTDVRDCIVLQIEGAETRDLRERLHRNGSQLVSVKLQI